MRLVTALFASLLSLLALSPAALAADVSAQDPARWVRFRADDGEVNRVTVTRDAGLVTVTDAGADLVAGDNCEQLAAREVRCMISTGDPRVDLGLGDADDEATVSGGFKAKLQGDEGNDVLTAADADDELVGGDGDDRLTGGPGIDTFDGGEGDDTISVRDGLRETVTCGGGADTVEADVEDDVAADCESVAKALPPAALDTVQPAETPPAPGDPGLTPGSSDLPGGAPVAPPVPGRTVSAAVKSGIVLVKRPGGSVFMPLTAGRPVPVGSVLDTRRGTVTLTSAADTAGTQQAADFKDGRFRVTQTTGSRMVTDLRMTGGSFKACRPVRAAGARAFAARRRTIRKLWGSGHGRFRTRGRNSSATVRGTIWQVEDRCDGTLTRVMRGVVAVKDLRTNRTKLVTAGHSLFVRRAAARR